MPHIIKVLCKQEHHTTTTNIYAEQQKNTLNTPANIDSQKKITAIFIPPNSDKKNSES